MFFCGLNVFIAPMLLCHNCLQMLRRFAAVNCLLLSPGIDVTPAICFRYNYRRISPAWDTIGPQKHIYLMLCCLVHSVTCYELPPYEPNEEEKKSPALFAANVRRYMLQYSGLKAAEATLEDKRRYQKRLTAAKEAEAAATAAAKDGTAAASLAERKRL